VVRSFIAIELPESIQVSIREFLDQLQSDLKSLPIRWVPVQNIHLTLKFLGDVPQDQIDSILDRLVQVARNFLPFDVYVQGFGCFPQPRKPRVLWLGLVESRDQLNRLQRDIDTELQSLGFEPESRRFHPHLTLGRVKNLARSDDTSAIARHLEDVKRPELGHFTPKGIHLIRSDLTPKGAVYRSLGYASFGETV
jgi:2'-5' RNA ligase